MSISSTPSPDPSFNTVGGYRVTGNTNTTTVSQKVEINGKIVTVSIHYSDTQIDPKKVKTDLENSIRKVVTLATALKFGEANASVKLDSLKIKGDDTVKYGGKVQGSFKASGYTADNATQPEFKDVALISDIYTKVMNRDLKLYIDKAHKQADGSKQPHVTVSSDSSSKKSGAPNKGFFTTAANLVAGVKNVFTRGAEPKREDLLEEDFEEVGTEENSKPDVAVLLDEVSPASTDSVLEEPAVTISSVTNNTTASDALKQRFKYVLDHFDTLCSGSRKDFYTPEGLSHVRELFENPNFIYKKSDYDLGMEDLFGVVWINPDVHAEDKEFVESINRKYANELSAYRKAEKCKFLELNSDTRFANSDFPTYFLATEKYPFMLDVLREVIAFRLKGKASWDPK